MQVYVLDVEFWLGAIALLVAASQLVFGGIAGLQCCDRKRDFIALFLASGAAGVAELMVLVLLCLPTLDATEQQAVYGLGWTVAAIGGGIAFVAFALVVQSEVSCGD